MYFYRPVVYLPTYNSYYNADEDYITHSCGGSGCNVACGPGGNDGLDLHHNTAPLRDNSTYSTFMYTAGIQRVIEEAGAAGSTAAPFFIYGAYQAVHGPLEAPARFVDACKVRRRI